MWSETNFVSFALAKKAQRGSEFVVLDRQGEELSSLRQNPHLRRLAWVELSAVSPAFVQKLLRAEDRRFYSHAGVDLKAMAAAVAENVWGRSRRGASTLTMQVARFLTDPEGRDRGYAGKLRQTIAAWKLERRWSKNEILEFYLNAVDFRGEYRGLSSASRAFFGKSPSGLNDAESSILAAMIRSPNAGYENIQRRACLLAPAECDSITARVTDLRSSPARVGVQFNRAPHFARWAWGLLSPELRREGSLRSTLDGELQDFVTEALRGQISLLKDQNMHDGAVLVLDNRSGDVLAYVGSSGDLSSSAAVDGVQAHRQVGSTLKPFLYGTAFEKKILTPDSWLEDSPVEIVFPNGVYRPQNHDKNFHGWVRARSALASSLNVPAVKVFKMLDGDSFWRTLARLHLSNLRDADLYGAALALGVADLDLWDLTNAYRSLANDGVWTPARWKAGEAQMTEERIFSPATAQSLRRILSSAQDRELGFGYDTSLATRFPSAVKTGTSKDMRDNWCFGFSRDYTVGVWVGNFNGQPMWNVLGVDGAAPLWAKTLTWLHEHRRSQSVPAAVPLPRTLSARPTAYPRAKIAYPTSGLKLAVDPDIPSRSQKIPLLTEGPLDPRTYWVLDGRYLGKATEIKTWPLRKGTHRFELKRGSAALDSAEISVR